MKRVRRRAATLVVVIAAGFLLAPDAHAQEPMAGVDHALGVRLSGRMTVATAAPVPRQRDGRTIGAMTPAERRAAIDAAWGPGLPTEEKLAIFDRFWNAVDTQFAAFQGIDDNWAALRARYRPEVAAGVSRGRFAAIMNQMSMALREGHSSAVDLLVNAFTVPEPGVPLLGVGGWLVDPSGACLTAQDDGSALVYDVMLGHPLGLQRGDRILGYDGTSWPELYRRLIAEELPLWPMW